jgi:NADP-dependent 3-hydroxy acid dehydrogenase YdfG
MKQQVNVMTLNDQSWVLVTGASSGFACFSISRTGSSQTLISGRSCAKSRRASGT